jgi:tellurite resistance protein
MELDTPLVLKLRQHLIEVAPSSRGPALIRESGAEVPRGSPEEDAIVDRFRPFAQLFYLVASADGEIDEDERHVMRGAFESLTAGRVGAQRIFGLEAELMTQAAAYDREHLLEQVCSALSRDREDAELAFTLAAVVAAANRHVERHEAQLVDQLASWLGVSARRAAELLKVDQRRSLPPPPSAL